MVPNATPQDEAVSQQQMMPYQEFISSRKSVYSRNWTIHPWWLLSWGMKQLGIIESSTAPGQLPMARFVIMRNVEACQPSLHPP